MTRSTLLKVSLVTCLATVQLADAAAQDGNSRTSVTVAFGVGLNTAQPGNSVNHHVLPNTIELKLGDSGGVVHFAVAGFHQIFVYNPGKRPADVFGPVPGSFFINDLNDLYYQGLVPAGGPPPGLPVTTNPSNASNRIESVGFFEPGLYLVICNVRQHFNDAMYAWVRVTR